jgi:hypothetical protein
MLTLDLPRLLNRMVLTVVHIPRQPPRPTLPLKIARCGLLAREFGSVREVVGYHQLQRIKKLDDGPLKSLHHELSFFTGLAVCRVGFLLGRYVLHLISVLLPHHTLLPDRVCFRVGVFDKPPFIAIVLGLDHGASQAKRPQASHPTFLALASGFGRAHAPVVAISQLHCVVRLVAIGTGAFVARQLEAHVVFACSVEYRY